MALHDRQTDDMLDKLDMLNKLDMLDMLHHELITVDLLNIIDQIDTTNLLDEIAFFTYSKRSISSTVLSSFGQFFYFYIYIYTFSEEALYILQ